MKNNYGKLTKKKAIELIYKYDTTLDLLPHKILDIEILKSKDETDTAVIYIKECYYIKKYYISCFGISVEKLSENNFKLLTTENVLLESEEKTNE